MAVPSGNFGNLTAGLIAKRLGLPVARFVAATNVNDAVPALPADRPLRAAATRCAPWPTRWTSARRATSSACSAIYGGDLDALRRDVIGRRLRRRARGRGDRPTSTARHGYLLDPHGAIGWLALNDALRRPAREAQGVFLATAHPAKFREVVEPAIGRAGAAAAGAGRAAITRPRHCAAAVGRLRGICATLLRNCVADIACHLSIPIDPAPAIRRRATRSPRATAGTCRAICRDWDEWSARYRELEAAIDGVRALPGHAGQRAARTCWRRFGRWTTWARSAIASGTTPRCSTTRTSATTTLNARRQQVQILFARQQQASAWFNPELLAIPLETDPRLDGGRRRRWRSTASPSRACFTSRSTCSTRRGSGCCRTPAASTACRTTATRR